MSATSTEGTTSPQSPAQSVLATLALAGHEARRLLRSPWAWVLVAGLVLYAGVENAGYVRRQMALGDFSPLAWGWRAADIATLFSALFFGALYYATQGAGADRRHLVAEALAAQAGARGRLAWARWLGAAAAGTLVLALGAAGAAGVAVAVTGADLAWGRFFAGLAVLAAPSLWFWLAIVGALGHFLDDLRAFTPVYLVLWVVGSVGGAWNLCLSWAAAVGPDGALQSWVWGQRAAWAAVALALVGLSALKRRPRLQRLQRPRPLHRLRLPSEPLDVPEPRPAPSSRERAWRGPRGGIGLLGYALRINLGWRGWLGVGVAAVLALILAGPIGPGAGVGGPGAAGRSFMQLFLAERLLPLLAFLVAAHVLHVEGNARTAEALAAMPGSRAALLREKAFALFAYLGGVHVAYVLAGIIVWPRFPATTALLLAAPTSCFLAALALAASRVPGRAGAILAYLAPGAAWFAAWLLDRSFPALAHPFYFSAEFSHFGPDLVVVNKLVLVGAAVVLAALAVAAPRRQPCASRGTSRQWRRARQQRTT